MDSVLENSINQGLKNNLKHAMEGAGVKVASNTGLWQYPEIIRNKMAVNTVNNINIVGGDCINVSYTADGDLLTYEISTSLDTYELKRPKWASDNNQWGKKLSVQNIFDDMFANILPSIRGVYAGDMTSTDYYGNDLTEWKHELFGVSGHKTGLKQSSRYLRLYLTSQHEPLFICVASNIEDITGGYNVGDSDTVSFVVDDGIGVMTAHVNVISDEQLTELGVIEEGDEFIENLDPPIDPPIDPEEPDIEE